MSVRRRAAPGAVDALRAELARAAVDARAYAAAPVGEVVVSSISVIRWLPAGAQRQFNQGGGSCLYYSLAQLYAKNTSQSIDADALRDALATYFEQNNAMFRRDHNIEVRTQALATKDGKSLRDVQSGGQYQAIAWSDAVPYYAQYMRKKDTWGGDVELDIAAEYFNVIIQRFDHSNYAMDSGYQSGYRLVTTFQPTNAGNLPTWIVGWRGNHFEAFFLSSDPPTPTAEDRERWEKKAETLKRERTSSEAMAPNPKRMAPETRDSDGGSCSLKPKTLTDDMLEQLRVVQTALASLVSPPADGDRWRPWKWRWW